MSDEEMTVHRDPETTPAQEKLGELTREIKNVLAMHGYPSSEAHAKVNDLKAAVLEHMWEELKEAHRLMPEEYKRWGRRGRRWAWLRGLDQAQDKVFRAMMRQEAWSRVLRNPRTVKSRKITDSGE